MNSRPKLLKLECELKLDTIPQKEGDPCCHFSAVVKKALFNDETYDIQNSNDMAQKLAKKIAFNGGMGGNSFLGSLQFAQALPGALPSNIAICYFGKFRDEKNPNINDKEKVDRAKELEGKTLTLTLDPQNWKILLPHGTKKTPTGEKTKLKQDLLEILSTNPGKQGISENNKIEIVALTSYNKDSNLLSLQISENSNDHKELLKYATIVTGSEETAYPTNSEGKNIPFSFSVAKLPNLMPVCEEILAAKNTAILKHGS